ncbi:MAG: S1C family serine protease [Planctomycetota bacterium]|jgi:serine protease DegQ
MRLRPAILLSALLLGLLSPGVSARADEELPEEVAAALERALDVESSLVATCEKVRRSSVSVLIKMFPRKGREIIEGEPARLRGVGSGVLIVRKGKPWVITNVHVVQNADVLEVVTSDGVTHLTEVRDTIRQYDIAVLSFPDPPRDLKTLAVRVSSGRDLLSSRDLEEGAWVVATGNPFFLALDGRSVTTLGVVSGTERILGGGFLYGNAIQHDAEVNPGNSGGPLWNLKGELIGINGMIATRGASGGVGPSNTGASFSIPIHQVNEFLLTMIDQRRDAQAGFLGATVQTATDDDGSAQGALVTAVVDKSPASVGRAALKPGDVITSIWNRSWQRINTASDVTNLLSLCPAGTFLKIKYKRGRSSYTWSGRLAEGR